MAESLAVSPAVLLISHGSRQPHAAAVAERLAAALRRDDPARVVAVSFLELNPPGPGEALQRLVRDGSSEIRVIPLLFAAGYHYRVDVPAALDAVRESHPDIAIRTAAPLLEDSAVEIIAALDARVDEVTGRCGALAAAPDGLVLLAAGSSDPLARLRVGEVADSWGRARGLPTDVAFCDLRGDDVLAAITRLRERGAHQIACGSLFLAAGRLLDVGHRVARESGAIAVAGPLGITPAMVDLLRRRCFEPVAAG